MEAMVVVSEVDPCYEQKTYASDTMIVERTIACIDWFVITEFI